MGTHNNNPENDPQIPSYSMPMPRGEALFQHSAIMLFQADDLPDVLQASEGDVSTLKMAVSFVSNYLLASSRPMEATEIGDSQYINYPIPIGDIERHHDSLTHSYRTVEFMQSHGEDTSFYVARDIVTWVTLSDEPHFTGVTCSLVTPKGGGPGQNKVTYEFIGIIDAFSNSPPPDIGYDGAPAPLSPQQRDIFSDIQDDVLFSLNTVRAVQEYYTLLKFIMRHA